MSKFIDKLNQLSRAEPQPIGFMRNQPPSLKPKIQLVVSLAQESAESLTGYVSGADAGLLSVSKPGSGAKTLRQVSQALPDIPWGGWLQGGSLESIEPLTKAGGDFVVFPATDTPLALLQNDKMGKILEVEASLSEGLLRAANELPVDAVLIAAEQRESGLLTWQDLMLCQRFADLLTKPLLVSIPPKVTAEELQALWAAGVDGVVVEVTAGQSQDRMQELRRVIDNLTFPLPRKREKEQPLLRRISPESAMATTEEEEEEVE